MIGIEEHMRRSEHLFPGLHRNPKFTLWQKNVD
jgi:hypothetical protein